MIVLKKCIYGLMIVWTIFVGLLPVEAKQFPFYWNIPSFMCKKYGFKFTNLTSEYGIIQNDNDKFGGNEFTILYDPGMFPALLSNSSSSQLYRRNGGVPQRGNMRDHLKIFERHVDELVPDPNNDGVAVIDFESWRPVYRQNFGNLQPYKDLSEKLIQQEYPSWTKKKIQAEASKQFTEAGRDFMETTLQFAKQLRPYAKWGYYGLPYCFNGRGNNPETCADNIKQENNGIQWLINNSDLILPSVYMSEQMPPNYRIPMVRGRVAESKRLRSRSSKAQNAEVLVYHRYVYTDTRNFLTESDFYSAIKAIKNAGADGVILWGSSFDLKTKKKCVDFYKYLHNTMGPIVRSFGRQYSVQEVISSLE